MSRRIVMELSDRQSLILRQAANRVMDARTVVDHEDAIYKALLGMVYPEGSDFDPTYGRGVFYVEEEDGEELPTDKFIRLMDDEDPEDETGETGNGALEVEVLVEGVDFDPLPNGDGG